MDDKSQGSEYAIKVIYDKTQSGLLTIEKYYSVLSQI